MVYKVNRVRQGFLLLEMLVAILLIATLSIVLSGIYIQIITTQTAAHNIIQATELASYTIKKCINDVQIVDSKASTGIFTIHTDTYSDALMNTIRWYKVIVYWKEKGVDKKVELQRGTYYEK